LKYSRNSLYLEKKNASDLNSESQEDFLANGDFLKCNRGILLNVGKSRDRVCLCPPTYYEMIVSLFDDDGQILYTSTLYCNKKRHIYLLYRFRSKNNSKNYHIIESILIIN